MEAGALEHDPDGLEDLGQAAAAAGVPLERLIREGLPSLDLLPALGALVDIGGHARKLRIESLALVTVEC
jgi:hypothetical protein